MRNVVTEASLSTRASQWWAAVPFITAGVVFLCSSIYIVTLIFGYDSFLEVCLLPGNIFGHLEVYRPYTSAVFHASIIHLVFNMLALVPTGAGLERLLGSVRYFHVLFIVATSNALLQVVIAYIAAYNPIHPYDELLHECGVGFSGIIFAMIVIETSLSGAQTRSIFGFFTVPAKWYPWALFLLFQLLMPRVSLLGHLSGILSGFAYTYGLFHYCMLSSTKYAAIEGLPFLAVVTRRPGFIVGGCGATTPLSLPSFTMPSYTGGPAIGRAMSTFQSWMPQPSSQEPLTTDERFPGRGQVLGSSAPPPPPARAPPHIGSRWPKPNSNQTELQTRLLDSSAPGSAPELPQNLSVISPGIRIGLQQVSNPTDNEEPQVDSGNVASLVSMGFDKALASQALIAANGDIGMAVEILSAQG